MKSKLFSAALWAGVFLLSSCSSLSFKPSETGIRYFGTEFHQFLVSSRSLSEDRAWQRWQGLLESADPVYFRKVVGGEGRDADWERSYRAAFGKALPVWRKYQAEIEAEFTRFPSLLSENLAAFRREFADFDLQGVPVYAVPSLLRFNGKATEAAGPKTLSFGIDTIVLMRLEPHFLPGMDARSNAKVLYAHEIFHVYHGKAQGGASAEADSLGELANDAWNEGLATFASAVLVPGADEADLLMDAGLASACREQGEALAHRFRFVAHERTQSEKGRALYRDWFQFSGQDSTLPKRAGYCVGLILARRASRAGFTLRQMAGWTYREIPSRLEAFLY
jgi:hypothetical protein